MNTGSTAGLREAAQGLAEDFIVFNTRPFPCDWGYLALDRIASVAESTGADLLYSDYYELVEAPDGGTIRRKHPVIDCARGALRDDFDFGPVLVFRSASFLKALEGMNVERRFGALYDLRLRMDKIVHIGEYLYTEIETDLRKSGEKQFDYVNPRNREVQIEMEKACTAHLKAIGAYLEPKFRDVNLDEGDFKYEASVVIPCKNRVRTIADAIRSALGQKTDFPYNVIVVDDNSTDGTVDVIRSFDDPRLIYIAQDETYHAIGGNWNAAVNHPDCGRFALQLDSDDLYSDENTVSRFVKAFREQNCAMVIGTYRITDFDLNTIPPGVIDHKEWTEENGRNNALRINGLGAPRGFFVPVLRQIGFPTVKYGEDYAVALRICRDYRIGRIWDVMYCCRRWDDNSDAALSIEKVNLNNIYKDRIRSWELEARIRKNGK